MSFFDYPNAAETAASASAGFLAHASDDEWELLRAHAELLHVAPGHLVIQEGVADRALYIILEGTLEAIVPHGRRGRSRRVSTMGAGTVLGEVGFFDGLPRTAAVQAATDSRLLRLTYDAFQTLAAKEPALGRQILLDIGRALAGRLRAVEALP